MPKIYGYQLHFSVSKVYFFFKTTEQSGRVCIYRSIQNYRLYYFFSSRSKGLSIPSTAIIAYFKTCLRKHISLIDPLAWSRSSPAIREGRRQSIIVDKSSDHRRLNDIH